MRNGMKVLAVAVVVLLGAGTLLAQGHRVRAGAGQGPDCPQTWDRMVEKADTNKDGKISKEEFLAFHPRFEKLDADKDGTVTKEEILADAPNEERAEKMFERHDANGDGKLTVQELNSRREEMFGKMDKDGNGTLEKGEFVPGCQQRRHRGGQQQD